MSECWKLPAARKIVVFQLSPLGLFRQSTPPTEKGSQLASGVIALLYTVLNLIRCHDDSYSFLCRVLIHSVTTLCPLNNE